MSTDVKPLNPVPSIVPTSTPSSAPSGTLYALPSATTGVAMNPPPLTLLPSISAAVAKACESIPKDKHGALVAIGTANGVNLAVVGKIGDDFAVTAWIGRSWKKDAALDWGAEMKLTF
jgi:hypothetical protein